MVNIHLNSPSFEAQFDVDVDIFLSNDRGRIQKYRTILLEENLRHLTDELIKISNVYFNLANKLKLQLHWSIINYSSHCYLD